MKRLLGQGFDFVLKHSSTFRFIYHSAAQKMLRQGRIWSSLRHWNLWSTANKHFIQGKLANATELWTHVLRDIYSQKDLDYDDYFPPFFSREYWNAFGHRAILVTALAAQDLGIVPKGKRHIKVPKQDINHPLLRALNHKLEVHIDDGEPDGVFPKDWSIFERLEILRSRDGFIEMYGLIDEVFKKAKSSKKNPLIELPGDYLEQSQLELERYGYDSSNWFVGLHVRDDGLTTGRRSQSINTYLPAISEILARGGQVIRIGDCTMPILDKTKGVIDLTQEKNSGRELHLFVLSESRFFIGTSSGPASYPSLFGVPTLFTNTTSIGRNTLAAAEHSFYVPKLLEDYKRILSFSEHLKTAEAFGELSAKELHRRGFHLKANSEAQILRAVVEMFDRLEARHVADNAIDREIDMIRSYFPFSSSGQISHSFIEERPEWINSAAV